MAPAERIRPSATVILWREAPELEVYLVERGMRTRFFPGYHAFPGGALDPADLGLPDDATPAQQAEAYDSVDARRRAALRELYEETGILVVNAPLPAALPARDEVLAKGLASFGLAWDLDALEPAGRLVTPPFGPARYDTSFFVCRLPEGQEPAVDGAELVTGRWWRPAEVLRLFEEKAMAIPPPTLAYLRLMARHGSATKAAEAARATDGRPHHERFRIEIHPGVYVLPLRTATLPPATTQNCYVLDSDPILVIDPGSNVDTEWPALFHTLDELVAGKDHFGEAASPPRERREILVLLTHHHHDHVGAVDAVQRRYGVRVLATSETRSLLPENLVDGIIADGHVFDVGSWRGRPWRVEVLHTPGHAEGHLAFRDARFGALFAGDLVSGVSTILIDPDEGDMGAYLRSLERCAAHEPMLVLPGHGPAQPGNVFANTLAHRRMRETKVLAALRAEPRRDDDLLAEVYADTPQAAWPLAARSLGAHLRHLEAQGKAARGPEGWRLPEPKKAA